MNKKKIIRAVTVDGSLGFVEPLIDDLTKDYEIQLLSSPGDKITALCKKYNLIGHQIPMFRRMSPLKDLKSLYRIIRVLKKEKPYMIHSMTPKAGLLCMLAAWIMRVPRRVHTFTGLVWPTASGFSRKILMFTDWLTCACATHIIPEGKGVMNDLKNHITNKKMKVLGFGNVKGVDMHRFSRRKEVMEQADSIHEKGIFTFLFVGRIVGDKGINELVEAFNMLNNEHKSSRLILVGKFEEKLDPLALQTLEIIKKSPIEIVGPKYGDELLSYYATSDCFVFPSYREGFPNTVMEAGAMGLASIVTDINGSREIITNGENGIIISPKNTNELYNAMKRILLDDNLRKKLANNARQMIESRFEQSFVKQCLYDFYKKII